jgi:hypothetical protein
MGVRVLVTSGHGMQHKRPHCFVHCFVTFCLGPSCGVCFGCDAHGWYSPGPRGERIVSTTVTASRWS